MIDYVLFLVIFTAIYALFSLGLNLQWGLTGLINFGHAAFLAIGAYTTVLLTLKGVPLFLAALIGGALAALLGLLIGFSTLRLREDYLAIVTIGVSELVRLVALNEEWLTRGAFGVQDFPLPLATFRPTIATRWGMVALVTGVLIIALWRLGQAALKQGTGRSPSQQLLPLAFTAAIAAFGIWLYSITATALLNYSADPARNGLLFLVIVVLAVTFWALERLVRSPWGRVLKAIREDEEVAKALGKNVFAYKLQSFMLGGFIAGIAGAFFAWQVSTVYPTNFEPLITFNAWTIVVLGGAGNNAGTLLGAAIFWAYTALTRDLDKVFPFLAADQLGALRIMLIGLILMTLMVWRPQGLLGKRDELTLGR
jgi:neutral amino acid transport system permease protein